MNSNPCSVLTSVAAISLWFAVAGCGSSPPNGSSGQTDAAAPLPEIWFEEAALTAGLSFDHSSGQSGKFYIPEMMAGGVGLLDYDSDGLLDVYCVQAGTFFPAEAAPQGAGNKLFRNLGQGQFEDVTAKAGVAGSGYGMGVACGDYDGDGDADIYITAVGANILYQNNGDGTFSDVTAEAGVGDKSWGASAAFLDYDRDSRLDLVIANYIHWTPDRELECYSRGGMRDYCSPLNYKAPAMDALYRNLGGGRFENTTTNAGLHQAFGNGLGVACADFNNDDWPDIYIANDATPNQLWINQKNGQFVEEAFLRGCAVNYLGVPEAGMGVVAADLRHTGWLDLFVTHLEGEANRLYLNTNGFFIDTITPDGPGASSWPYTGFGVGFADFDHDGELDLFVANGKVKRGQTQYHAVDPYQEPNQLLRGKGGARFELIPNAGLNRVLLGASRGAAFGDLDNDGDIDIVVINKDGPLHFLRNISPKRGEWISFDLRLGSGAVAVGAKVRVQTGARTWRGRVAPNEGYCSSNDPRVHFGLGPVSAAEAVLVHWPDGSREEFGPFPTSSFHRLQQGLGRRMEPASSP